MSKYKELREATEQDIENLMTYLGSKDEEQVSTLLNNLGMIDLSEKKLNSAELTLFAEAMKHNNSVAVLSLRGGEDRGTENIDWTSPERILKKNLENLEKLDNNSVKVFADALKMNTTITSLTLNLSAHGDSYEYIADALKNNKTVAQISFNSSKMGNEGIKHIAEALKVNEEIHWVGLRFNKIGAEGAQYLSDALKENTSIDSLDLMRNKIGAEGAFYIAEALKVNTTLRSLNLKKNNIMGEGAKSISEALEVNAALDTLDMCYNKIGDVGASYIANALLTNKPLSELNLAYNEITDQTSAKAIANCLKNNTTLTSLDLMKNKIDDIGVKIITAAMSDNATLTFLGIAATNMSSAGLNDVARLLKTNGVLQDISLTPASGILVKENMNDIWVNIDRNNELQPREVFGAILEKNNLTHLLDGNTGLWNMVADYLGLDGVLNKEIWEDYLYQVNDTISRYTNFVAGEISNKVILDAKSILGFSKNKISIKSENTLETVYALTHAEKKPGQDTKSFVETVKAIHSIMEEFLSKSGPESILKGIEGALKAFEGKFYPFTLTNKNSKGVIKFSDRKSEGYQESKDQANSLIKDLVMNKVLHDIVMDSMFLFLADDVRGFRDIQYQKTKLVHLVIDSIKINKNLTDKYIIKIISDLGNHKNENYTSIQKKLSDAVSKYLSDHYAEGSPVSLLKESAINIVNIKGVQKAFIEIFDKSYEEGIFSKMITKPHAPSMPKPDAMLALEHHGAEDPAEDMPLSGAWVDEAKDEG